MPARGKTWTLIERRSATIDAKAGSSFFMAAATSRRMAPSRLISALSLSWGNRLSSARGTNPGAGAVCCASRAEETRKRARAKPGMMVLRMSKLLLRLPAPVGGGLLRGNAERETPGGRTHQAPGEHVVPQVETGAAAHLADVGQGEASLLGGLRDLRGARLMGALGADEEGSAPQGEDQHRRRSRHTQGEAGPAGTERHHLSPLPSHPLQDLRRAVELGERAQLCLDPLG